MQILRGGTASVKRTMGGVRVTTGDGAAQIYLTYEEADALLGLLEGAVTLEMMDRLDVAPEPIQGPAPEFVQ